MNTHANTNMTLSEELAWRGLLNQTTFKDITEIDKKVHTIYHGFDASADSQTIGNLASMMIDLCFLRHGHRAIVLAGGATSLIGDAGGRDTERPMQPIETIEHNIQCAKTQLTKIYRGYDFTLVNNIDWTKDLNMLDYLRDIGKYFNVGEMIKKEYISTRIGEGGSGISYTEFSYSLLQAYDFLHLFDTYGCTLQLCGADQWTNCLAGVELIKKKRGKEAHVITNPLIINKKTGKKFGKSEAGAVWLDKEKTSVFDFYQFWINVDDEGAKDYVKIYTAIMPDEYTDLLEKANAKPEMRYIQKHLAYHVTSLVHGKDEANTARMQAESLFTATRDPLLDESIPWYDFKKETDFLEFITQANMVSSKSEVRRLLSQGGLSIDGTQISEFPAYETTPKTFLFRVGKKHYYKIRKV